jgi:hypothetical protein
MPYLRFTQKVRLSGKVLVYNAVVTMRLALSKGPNRVAAFLTSPEDGNRSSFRKGAAKFLEYRTMDRVQKASNSE